MRIDVSLMHSFIENESAIVRETDESARLDLCSYGLRMLPNVSEMDDGIDPATAACVYYAIITWCGNGRPDRACDVVAYLYSSGLLSTDQVDGWLDRIDQEVAPDACLSGSEH